jgi:N-formylglutamate deformylase
MMVSAVREPVRWEIEGRRLPLIAVAVHAGHEVSPEVDEIMELDESDRIYEGDPGTESLARVAPVRAIGRRSRFEVDLNRPREEAVYLDGQEPWAADVWKEEPPKEIVHRALEIHDSFYERFEPRSPRWSIVTEGPSSSTCHSYNHRRAGPEAPPADPQQHPEVNVGTGSLNNHTWGDLVERFQEDLAAAGDLDVRENVRFRGREVLAFVHPNFPGEAYCLALEFKKTYMDEHSGHIDEDALSQLEDWLRATIPGIVEELDRVSATGAARPT